MNILDDLPPPEYDGYWYAPCPDCGDTVLNPVSRDAPIQCTPCYNRWVLNQSTRPQP